MTQAQSKKDHRDWLKVGTRVEARHPNGESTVQGRVDGNDICKNGLWIAVNIAPKGKNRVLKHYRRRQLTLI